MKHTAFGRTGNVIAPRDKGRVTTHEVGHWLNLFHIWGDYYCGNDLVADTPEQEGPVRGCPSFPLFSSNCANNGPHGDMFMNFMDYSNDDCRNIFTAGQRMRGRAVFATSPRNTFVDNYFRVAYPTITYCTGTATLFNPLCLTPTWSISSGPAYISAGQGTNQVTFTITGSGSVTLRATAGNYVSEQSIDVVHILPTIGGTYFTNGQEQFLRIYSSPFDYNDVCNLENVSTNMQVTGATSVTWSKTTSNPTNVSWYQSGNNLNFYLWSLGQTALFKLLASNSCGTTSYDFGFRSIDCTGGGGGCELYSVSPNPASGSINVSVVMIPPPCDFAMASSELTISEVNIYDQAGNIKKTKKEMKSKKTTVNLDGLRTGIYVVEIIDGKYKERHQVIVTK